MLTHNSLLEKRDKLPKNRTRTTKFDKHQQTLDLIAEYQSPETLPHQKERLADQIIAINEGLCRKAANRYTYPGVDIEVLVNLGRTGMKRAIDEFDLGLGYKFSTYAMPWIRQQIRLSVQHDNPIHVPDSAHRVNRKAQKLIARGITDTQEIAEILGKDASYVQACIDMCRRVKQIPATPEGNEILFSDSVLIAEGESFDYDSLNGSQKIVRQALSKLNPIIQEIVLKRLDGWKFKEIAKFYQLASTKVQSIYKQVMAWIEGLLSPDQPESNATVQTESTQIKPQALTVDDNESTDTASKDSEPVVTTKPAKSNRRNRWNIFTQLLGRLTDRAALKPNGDRPATNLFSSARNSTLPFLQSFQNLKTACLDVDQVALSELDTTVTEQNSQAAITEANNSLNSQVIGHGRNACRSRLSFGPLQNFLVRSAEHFKSNASSPSLCNFFTTSRRFCTDIASKANAAVMNARNHLKLVGGKSQDRGLLAKLLQHRNWITFWFCVLDVGVGFYWNTC